MKKYFTAILLVFGLFFLFLFSPINSVLAACAPSTQFGMHIVIRDAGGNLIPSINYAVYTEIKNPDGNPYFDDKYKLTSGKTDGGGQSDVLCLNAAKYPYAVKLWETNATYGYFSIWSDKITGQGGIFEIEAKMSDLFVIIRDAEGNLVKNSSFDVFVQGFDVDNKPIIDETKLNQDKLVAAKVNTSDVGGKHLYLAPGSYAVRMYVTGGKEYFYLWNQQISAEQNTTLDYRQGTLRTTLEDGNGNLVKNQTFYIYTQKYDARNKPITGDLLATMQTGSTGKADAYLSTGEYAIKIPSTSKNLFYYIWKVKVSDGSLTDLKYRLSGLRVILRDDNGEVVKNAKFSISSQKIDALGRPVVDTAMVSGLNTGEGAFKDVYLPAGTYVLVYGKKNLYQIDVADTYFTKIDWSKYLTARLHKDAALSNPLKNVNLTMRKTALPKINLSGFNKSISTAFKIEASRIEAPYTATFYYTEEQLKKKKVKAKKVAIAFYNQATKKWQYIGKNYPSRKIAAANIKGKGIIVLVAKK
ncbi:MAG TPA: hypothetical protein VJC01_02005 [Candidatus Paceibacterota bacterium]